MQFARSKQRAAASAASAAATTRSEHDLALFLPMLVSLTEKCLLGEKGVTSYVYVVWLADGLLLLLLWLLLAVGEGNFSKKNDTVAYGELLVHASRC